MSIVTKFVIASVILLIVVAWAGVTAIWNNQPSFSGGTPDFNYWQQKYQDIAYDLATTPATKDAVRTPIVVEQYTVQQFPFMMTDGTAQQRVDRCESCHIGVENPMMTAENIIREVDHTTVAPGQVAAYLEAHPTTRDVVFTLGVHPGRGAYDTLTAQSLIQTLDNATVDATAVTTYLAAHPATRAAVYSRLGLPANATPDQVNKAQKIIYHNGVVKGNLPWAVVVGDGSDGTAHARAAEDDHVVSAHPFATYGCTTCHYGSGRELVQARAHGHSDFWLQPMLPAKYQDAACAQCHETYNPTTFAASYLPEMTTIARGEQLFKQNACWGCHKIEGFSKGNVGPELTIEGRIATYETIDRQLWDPRYKVNNCVMPYFFSDQVFNDPDSNQQYVLSPLGQKIPASDVPRGNPENPDTAVGLEDRSYIPDASRQGDVDALVTFVVSQTGLNYAQNPSGRMSRITNYNSAAPPTVPVTAAAGKLLFSQSGCYSCHYLGDPDNVRNGRGGIAGPNLSWEGARHSREWIVAHYLNPQAFVPKSIMPVFPFSDSQRAALSLYDSTFIPKGAKGVSQDQDMPTQQMLNDDIVDPQVRYMTR